MHNWLKPGDTDNLYRKPPSEAPHVIIDCEPSGTVDTQHLILIESPVTTGSRLLFL